MNLIPPNVEVTEAEIAKQKRAAVEQEKERKYLAEMRSKMTDAEWAIFMEQRRSNELMEAQLRQDQAAIDTARTNLSYTTITAPISGRISASTVTEGALVTAQQATALATILANHLQQTQALAVNPKFAVTDFEQQIASQLFDYVAQIR